MHRTMANIQILLSRSTINVAGHSGLLATCLCENAGSNQLCVYSESFGHRLYTLTL